MLQVYVLSQCVLLHGIHTAVISFGMFNLFGKSVDVVYARICTSLPLGLHYNTILAALYFHFVVVDVSTFDGVLFSKQLIMQKIACALALIEFIGGLMRKCNKLISAIKHATASADFGCKNHISITEKSWRSFFVWQVRNEFMEKMTTTDKEWKSFKTRNRYDK